MNAQEIRATITLKGSAAIVSEYLNYACHSILFQRGIYPPEDFNTREFSGISLLVSKNEKIIQFINDVLKKAEELIISRGMEKVCLVLIDVMSKKTIERWDFKIVSEEPVDGSDNLVSEKPYETIQAEIRNVMRQITASISFLPLIQNSTSFDLLLYANETACAQEPPSNWSYAEDSEFEITRAQIVPFRSVSTDIDKVEAAVTYKQSSL